MRIFQQWHPSTSSPNPGIPPALGDIIHCQTSCSFGNLVVRLVVRLHHLRLFPRFDQVSSATERPASAIPPFCSAEFEPTSLSWYSGQLEISSRSHSHRSSPGPLPWDRINTPAYRAALRDCGILGRHCQEKQTSSPTSPSSLIRPGASREDCPICVTCEGDCERYTSVPQRLLAPLSAHGQQ